MMTTNDIFQGQSLTAILVLLTNKLNFTNVVQKY